MRQRRERTGDDGRSARAAEAALGPRGRPSRIPEAVRAEVLAYARRELAAGRSWAGIAHAVGLSAGALKNWSQTPAPARRLVPVAGATPAPEGPGAALGGGSPGGRRRGGVRLAGPAAVRRGVRGTAAPPPRRGGPLPPPARRGRGSAGAPG